MTARTTWYYCTDCQRYIQGRQVAVRDHRDLGHLIKLRTPIEQRITYSLNGEPQIVNVDGVNWTCLLRLLHFKSDVPNPYYRGETWRYNSSSNLNGNLEDVAKKLSHIHPSNPITKAQLEKLIVTSIRQGKYDELARNRVALNICLDTDTQLQPKTPESTWTVITSSQLKSLVKGEAESEAESLQHANCTRLT